MKLIDEWKSFYKFASVQVGAVGGAALVTWIALPAEQQHALLSMVGLDAPAYAVLAGVIVAIVSRLVAKSPPKE